MTTATIDWTVHTHPPGTRMPGRTGLAALRDGRVGLFRLPGHLDPAALAQLQTELDRRRGDATVNRYSNADLTTFGPYLAKHLRSPADYFTLARTADDLFPNPVLDLRAQVRRTLAEAFGLDSLEVATEADDRRYAAAVVRLHADGVCNPLHNDHIARDAAGTGLRVGGVRSQFSCVVCLQECTVGGELELYRKLWEPADERFKIAGGLGYDAGVVAGADRITFKPHTGDIYVMNPVHYHAINTVGGDERRTLGFFFGFESDDLRAGIAWG